jgi:hypothetical protein
MMAQNDRNMSDLQYKGIAINTHTCVVGLFYYNVVNEVHDGT